MRAAWPQSSSSVILPKHQRETDCFSRPRTAGASLAASPSRATARPAAASATAPPRTPRRPVSNLAAIAPPPPPVPERPFVSRRRARRIPAPERGRRAGRSTGGPTWLQCVPRDAFTSPARVQEVHHAPPHDPRFRRPAARRRDLSDHRRGRPARGRPLPRGGEALRPRDRAHVLRPGRERAERGAARLLGRAASPRRRPTSPRTPATPTPSSRARASPRSSTPAGAACASPSRASR